MRFALKGDKEKAEKRNHAKELAEEIEDLELITESLEKDIEKKEREYEIQHAADQESHQEKVKKISAENNTLRAKLKSILLRSG